MFAACFLSFCSGFLSLSLEIIWIRLFAFANHSLPQAFAFVLTFYLLGIAIGAQIGRTFCQMQLNLWQVAGGVLFISSFADLFSPWLYVYYAKSEQQLLLAAALIMLVALLKAIIFPIAHHLGVADQTPVGRRIANVYVANIIGATLGPIVIGFFLFSILTTQQCFIFCAAATFLLSFYSLMASQLKTVLVLSLLFFSAVFGLIHRTDSNWLIAQAAAPFGKLSRIIENQHGIITVYEDDRAGDIIAGGNVYDGRTNLNPVINSNGIHRVIVMDALCDHPKKILMIGLSIGSWLKLVTAFQDVEAVDVVEINPGYLKAMENYPRHYSALLDPRVHIYIDDGRRWLKANPRKKYDMIIMNATYHWRAYASNLLSREFLQLIKQHMKPNAVITYNTTGSPDALKTSTSIFSYAFLYENFVIAADFDWRKKMHSLAAKEKLAGLNLDGTPLFPPGSEALLESFLFKRLISLEEIEPIYAALGRKLEIITDHNIITEYKYGHPLTQPIAF